MSDRVWTKLTFPSYALRIPDVAAAIDKESPEDIEQEEVLTTIASNTYDGFDVLQPVLVKLRIPFDFWTEADYERAERISYYRPGEHRKQDFTFMQTLADGLPVVQTDEIARAMNRKNGIKAVKALLQRHVITPLNGFTQPPARLKKLLTLPDAASLKEFQVSFSATAVVQGSIGVKAATREEAEQRAQDNIGDVVWKYQGLAEGMKPEVSDCRTAG